MVAAVRTADAVREMGGQAFPIGGDISKPKDVEAIIAAAEVGILSDLVDLRNYVLYGCLHVRV